MLLLFLAVIRESVFVAASLFDLERECVVSAFLIVVVVHVVISVTLRGSGLA